MKKYLKWKRKKILKTYMFVVGAIVVFLLILFLVSSFLSEMNKRDASNPDVHFRNCKLLAGNCLDVTKCNLNVYCGDGHYKDCRVYDCGKSYGVFTKGSNDKIAFNNIEKPDESVVASISDNCSGTMQILSEECKDKRTEIRLKINTKGKCEIESIATVFENIGTLQNTFSTLDDGTYLIIADTCEKLKQIIPVAKGGVRLDLKNTGV